jgi:hypothetical protein
MAERPPVYRTCCASQAARPRCRSLLAGRDRSRDLRCCQRGSMAGVPARAGAGPRQG